MPPKKRKSIGQVQPQATKRKKQRKQETPEERNRRLAILRESAAASRASETREQREARLQYNRERAASSRASETRRQYESQLQDRTETARRSRNTQHLAFALEGFHYDPNKEYSQHSCVNIGEMEVVCSYCQARRFPSEPPGLCCKNGKVKLPRLQPPPQELLTYTSGDTPDAEHFLTNIRKYNSCFQMTSFGATSVVQHPGLPSTFTVQGQIHHKVGSLLPLPDQPPKFLQLYFLGNEQMETDQRCAYISGTRPQIVSQLQKMLHEHNYLIKTLKTALGCMPMDEYKVVIRADPGEHDRRFSAPQAHEVAVVVSGDAFDQRGIIIQRRGDSLQRISETHRSYDALQYPLLFPHGEDGYHFNLRQVDPTTGEPTSKKVSAMDFYAYMLMVRDTQQNHILNCRQLFHQFVVDAYAKIESECLLYIRLNQCKLRVEEYIHLKDAMANDGNIKNLGALVILPATFTGSPRHIHEYTQDAMMYVRTYGRPDLFITFTCNPTWTDIKDGLANGQLPSDRHDLIARVFRQKQLKIIDMITKGHVFGLPSCWMYTIEWEKRGLPRSRNLIWLANKIHPAQIDDIISAELPDPTQDPELFTLVTTNMIHGPCGNLNPTSPCMKDGKCTKKYPRTLIKETQIGHDGYPLYRRRAPEDGGFTAKLKMGSSHTEVDIDNRWVVPFSPLLSKMFHAHINVEYCNSVKSIKYICKYVNKGDDTAACGISSTRTNDEVIRYQSGRSISSNEAVWRILGFPIHESHPTVVHLSAHLENGQRGYFKTQTGTAVINHPQNTTLTAFFQLCQQDSFARTLLYPDIPRYYRWDASRKGFCRRKLGQRVPGHDTVTSDHLGRVYTIHPNNTECYFLRILLHSVPGPTTFADIRTVNGEVCQTFREACQKLGLLEGDQYWDSTLQEAKLISQPEQIRNLFAIILTTCSPSNPKILWERYKETLSEDILAKLRREKPTLDIILAPDIFNKALIILEDKCMAMINKTLLQLGLPAPVRHHRDVLHADYVREKNYNVVQLTAYITHNKPLLNQDQKKAYQMIMDRLAEQQGGIIFLEASSGTGKTFLINLILAEIRAQGQVALAIASSEIAATLMEGGRTARSALNLPLDIAGQENPTCNISKASGRAQVLRTCQLIVWDECTMAHKKALEALDVTLRDLRRNDNLMGGALVLLCGDFRQTLPIIPKSTPADEIHACLKESFLWKHVQKITLNQNMRVHLGGDSVPIFSNKLLQIGEGTLPVESSGNIKLPSDFCNLVSSTADLIEAVYPAVAQNYHNFNWLRDRAILAPKNEDIHKINSQILAMLPGIATEYKSFDTVVDADEAINFPPEFLNSLDPPGLPPHRLSLKVGSPIILLRNLDPPKLCHGTRLCVKKMLPSVIEATILTGKGEDETVFIPRIPLIPTYLPFHFKRVQFPVQLAFSITISKAQGQSIKYCGVDLTSPCFSHGQLYLACSRVASPMNLFILAPEGETKNIVYHQVLH